MTYKRKGTMMTSRTCFTSGIRKTRGKTTTSRIHVTGLCAATMLAVMVPVSVVASDAENGTINDGYYTSLEVIDTSNGWIAYRTRSDLDDSPMVVVSKKISGYADKKLALRCVENETSLIFLVNEPFFTRYGEGVEIYYRFDDDPPVKDEWFELTTNKGAIIAGNDAIGITRKMLDSESMFLRIVARSGRRYEAKFGISGLRPYASDVAKACNWSVD